MEDWKVPHRDGVKQHLAPNAIVSDSLSPPWERAGVRGRAKCLDSFPLTLPLSHQRERELIALT